MPTLIRSLNKTRKEDSSNDGEDKNVEISEIGRTQTKNIESAYIPPLPTKWGKRYGDNTSQRRKLSDRLYGHHAAVVKPNADFIIDPGIQIFY